MAKTPYSQYRGPGFSPWSGNWIPHAATKCSNAATKTSHAPAKTGCGGGGGGLVTKSYLTLAIPWTVAHQVPLSMGFSRREYWSGLAFPSPGDLPDPGIKPVSLASAALADEFFTS